MLTNVYLFIGHALLPLEFSLLWLQEAISESWDGLEVVPDKTRSGKTGKALAIKGECKPSIVIMSMQLCH